MIVYEDHCVCCSVLDSKVTGVATQVIDFDGGLNLFTTGRKYKMGKIGTSKTTLTFMVTEKWKITI